MQNEPLNIFKLKWSATKPIGYSFQLYVIVYIQINQTPVTCY